MDVITRTNLEQAEKLGMLDEHKILSGVPLSYKFVTEEEIEILNEAGIPYWPRKAKVIGPAFGGWVEPHVREILDMDVEYAGMSVAEFIRRMLGKWP